ncbi:MAG: RluA family pseudouridine synthase [Oligoflexia bacterium]|nr:RluA family pseudouridine synthase [Oligoflexia bacterium]
MQKLQLFYRKKIEDSRLDKIIPSEHPAISRNTARKLIESGSVYVNRKRCRQNAKILQVGDQITLHFPDESRQNEQDFVFKPELILYEDESIIVVNKPPFLPTHDTIDSSRNNLARSLKVYLEKQKPNPYLGIHHRLDRETSGAILFTKKTEANAAIAQAFQDRTVKKTYLAIVEGLFEKEVTIENHIGPSKKNKRIQASVFRGGKYAKTTLTPLQQNRKTKPYTSLVVAKPETGRMHQIRVHLSEANYPILGDPLYGRQRERTNSRLMLHAWKLEILGKTFIANPPEDFLALDFEPPKS